MAEISIIIRTKNEEKWIGHCLKSIYLQTLKSFEIILVDNESSDHTIEIAKRYKVNKILKIKDFLPGKALNDGIRASKGKFLVFISAHCIPKNNFWLENLRKNFEIHDKIAGVYGRQLPVSFTEDVDKRDLMLVFGRDYRIQKKDYFFHNANSMIKREVWNRFNFDETLTNIEDRLWGKHVINAGYQIAYDPESSVYHYHGLHQGNKPERAKSIASIIDDVDCEVVNELPKSLLPEFINVAAVLPVLGEVKTISDINLLEKSIEELKQSKFLNNIYLLGEKKQVKKISQNLNVEFIDREKKIYDPDYGLENILKSSLIEIEDRGDFPDLVLYNNYLVPFRPPNLTDKLIKDAQYKGLDTVFPGYVDYANYWKLEDSGFIQVGDSVLPRSIKNPFYKALYGGSCLTLSSFIRKGQLIGDKVGIIPFSNFLYTLRVDDETPEKLIELALKEVSFKNV